MRTGTKLDIQAQLTIAERMMVTQQALDLPSNTVASNKSIAVCKKPKKGFLIASHAPFPVEAAIIECDLLSTNVGRGADDLVAFSVRTC